MDKYTFSLIEETNMTPEIDQAIRDLLCICFPPDVEAFSKERPWNNVLPEYTIICEHNDKLVGQVGVVCREIICGGERCAVAGIQSMAVIPEMRGIGLAQTIMKASTTEAAQRGVRYGMLFCCETLARKFYSRMGWIRTCEKVTMLNENGKSVELPDKNVAMYLPLTGESLPAGPIDLLGREW